MSPTTTYSQDHDRSAGGLDYDDPVRERAHALGSDLIEKGPEALLEEIENMLPESWREQITSFPVTALIVGAGIGIFLGMKKGEDILAAGSSMITAAAMTNFNQVMDRAKGS